MKLNSKILGLIVLVVIFGGITAFSALGWWQTERGGQGNRSHGNESDGGARTLTLLHGTLNGYDLKGLVLTLDDGSALYIKLGNSRYNQSIGFAPQVGQGLTILGFNGEDGLFKAVTVTLDDGRVYSFRTEAGDPLWSGNGQGNGDSP